MAIEVTALFDNPSAVAVYIGESVGTHYTSALLAAEAYGKYLAADRESLLLETFEGEGLGTFWFEMIQAEKVRVASPSVRTALNTTPSHYFSEFLDTADTAFVENYKNVSEERRKKIGHHEHALCLRLLRDHNTLGLKGHFEVQNKVAGWIQMMRLMGTYPE